MNIKNKQLKTALLEEIEIKKSHNKEYQFYYYENLSLPVVDKRISKNVFQKSSFLDQTILLIGLKKHPLKKIIFNNAELLSTYFLKNKKKTVSLIIVKDNIFQYSKTFDVYKLNQNTVLFALLNVSKSYLKILQILKYNIK
jgi:hypothetical protein